MSPCIKRSSRSNPPSSPPHKYEELAIAPQKDGPSFSMIILLLRFWSRALSSFTDSPPVAILLHPLPHQTNSSCSPKDGTPCSTVMLFLRFWSSITSTPSNTNDPPIAILLHPPPLIATNLAIVPPKRAHS